MNEEAKEIVDNALDAIARKVNEVIEEVGNKEEIDNNLRMLLTARVVGVLDFYNGVCANAYMLVHKDLISISEMQNSIFEAANDYPKIMEKCLTEAKTEYFRVKELQSELNKIGIKFE